MKFSKYNECFEIDGKTYLYNILSTALAEIDNELNYAIKNDNPNNLNDSLLDLLKCNHFIVENDCDEVKEYIYYYNSIRFGRGSRQLNIIFIPTYNCNLSCPYCMQGLDKSHDIISKEAIESLIKFVDNRILESNTIGVPINELNISLFGEEPLLTKKSVLPSFCEQIKAIAIKSNCTLNFSMTSNFTLLDDEVIDLIKKYNIKIQVSIDGTKEQHDSRRITHDGKGTYNLIVDNLKKMNTIGLKKNLIIRINIDNDNIDKADSIMASIADMADDIYFGYLDNFKGSNDAYTVCIEHDSYADMMNKRLIPVYQKYGKIVPRSFGKMTPCSMHCDNRFIIDLSLNVYKCELLINKKEASVGFIEKNGTFVPNSNFYSQMYFSPDKVERCKNCKLLPLCGGGCTGKAFVNGNKSGFSFDGVSCNMREEDLVNYLKQYVCRIKQ